MCCVFSVANLFVLWLIILCSVYFFCYNVWLSVPVQSITWKDSSPKNDLLCVEWDVKLYTLAKSLLILYFSILANYIGRISDNWKGELDTVDNDKGLF